jgi:mono/diheme cytochrome c family protein
MVCLFLQFYAARFGRLGQYFGTILFPAYLTGLVAPIPLHAYPRCLAIAVTVVGACILARAVLCWYSPAWDLRQTQRVFLAACHRAAANAAGVLEGGAWASWRLSRDLDRVNLVALVSTRD